MIRSDALARPFPSVQVDRQAWLWVGLVAVAGVVRFRELGARPLDPDEARTALEAFQNVGFGRQWASPESTAPGYTGLMSVLLFLFGSSDAGARLISAAAGTTLVALSWLLRPLIGMSGALGVAGLFVVSPILTHSARSALGAALLTLLLFMVLLVSARIVQEVEQARPVGTGWLFALGSVLAAGLATDTTFAMQVVALVAALVFAFDLSLLRARWGEVRTVRPWPILLGFGLTTVLYTTRLLTNPGGLQTGLVDALWVWPTELLQPGRAPLVALILVLGTEGLVLVCAICGGIRLAGSSPLERFAGVWAIVTFALAIIGGRTEYRLLAPAVLAGAVLGGSWVGRVAQDTRWRDPMTYLVGGLTAVPLIAAVTASLPALRGSSSPPTQVVVAGVAGCAGTIVGACALVGRRTTAHGLIFLALTIGLLGTIVGAGRLSASTWTDLGRAGPGANVTADLREVERQLAIWEWDQDRRSIAVDDRLQPILGWALRSNHSVRWTSADDVRTAPGVKLLASRGEAIPERGLRVTIGYRFTALTELSPIRVAEWLAWRRSIPRVEPYDILLFR